MGYAKVMRDSSGDPIKNSFKKESTAGDIFRIDVREPGKLHMDSFPSSPSTFTLPFSYQVGQHQLVVHAVNTTSGEANRLFSDSTWGGYGVTPTAYYEEVDDTTVKVYGPTGTAIVFSIPHTSTPGAFTSNVIVESQSDDIGIKLKGSGNGILFTSPNGRKWLLRMDDEGSLARQEVL